MFKAAGKQKDLEIVAKPENADFFVEYRTISRQPFGFGGTTETGQIDVYLYRGKTFFVDGWTISWPNGAVSPPKRFTKKANPSRTGATDTFVGYDPQLEDFILPQSEDVANAVNELAKY